MTGGEIKLLVRRPKLPEDGWWGQASGHQVSRWEWKPRRESRELI